MSFKTSWENFKAARAVGKQFRESSTYFQSMYDAFKIGYQTQKDKTIFIKLIDHKTPVERWEYKYGYLKYWQKFKEDLEAKQHIWDVSDDLVMMPFKDFVIAAMNDPISPRNYMSGMVSSMFITSAAGCNVHFT